MKQQSIISPSKANSTNKDLNNREDDVANIEFQKIIVGMITEPKEDTHKLVSNLKE
jgi:hypothetical protein